MSAQVVFPQEAIPNQSISGEAGNDSSGPASVLASTPESGSPPLATEAISDNISKKVLVNHSSYSMEQESQNGHSETSKSVLTNGSSLENSTPTIITQITKLTNGHHDATVDNIVDVVTSSNPVPLTEPATILKPEIKEISDAKENTAAQDPKVAVTMELTSSASVSVPPASSTVEEKVAAQASRDDTDSSSYEPDLAEDTDESYASDLESAAADLPSREIIRKYHRDRSDIAWRWSWLQLQTAELEHQLKRSDEAYQKLRKARVPPQPLIDPKDGDDHALRTSGFAPPKKKRKFLKRTKMPVVTKATLLETALAHPLFNVPERADLIFVAPKPPPNKRGRKPGSTNKPKAPPPPPRLPIAPVSSSADDFEEEDEDDYVFFEEDLAEEEPDEEDGEFALDEDQDEDLEIPSHRHSNQYATPIKSSGGHRHKHKHSHSSSSSSRKHHQHHHHHAQPTDDAAEYTPNKKFAARSPLATSVDHPPGRGKSVNANTQTVTGNSPPLAATASSAGADLLSPKAARQRREKALAAALRETEFEDAIVIPASLMNTHQSHTPLLPPVGVTKEIFTPKWKMKQKDDAAALLSSSQGSVSLNASQQSVSAERGADCVRLINNGLDAAGAVVEFDDSEEGIRKQLALLEAARAPDAPPSDEEDTGDEAYAKRHAPKEEFERSRYTMPPVPAPSAQKKKSNSRSLTDSSGRAIPDSMLVTSDPTGASRRLDFSSGGDVPREPKKRGRKPLPKHLLKKQPKSTSTAAFGGHSAGGAPARASGWRKWVRGTDFLDASWQVSAELATPAPSGPPPAMELPSGIASETTPAPAVVAASVVTLAAAPTSESGIPKLVIRLKRAAPLPGAAETAPFAVSALGASHPPPSHLSYSQNSESSMWSERSELMASSFSLQTGGGDDSLPPLALSLPPSLPSVVGGELSMSTMSMVMPPSAPELHSHQSVEQPHSLQQLTTPHSPPLDSFEDSNAAAAEISMFFEEQQSTSSSSSVPATTSVASTVAVMKTESVVKTEERDDASSQQQQ